MSDKIKIKNVHNGNETMIDPALWAKKKDSYKGTFIEVPGARIPPEVKELKKKQAEQSTKKESISPPEKTPDDNTE